MRNSMGTPRTDITEAQRKKAVRRALDGESVTKVANEIGTSFQTLRTWASNPEYGGDPNWVPPRARAAAEGSPLPLERAPAKRAYKHEINFCPRCGLNLKG